MMRTVVCPVMRDSGLEYSTGRGVVCCCKWLIEKVERAVASSDHRDLRDATRRKVLLHLHHNFWYNKPNSRNGDCTTTR
jgi:hypothetical protein